MVLLDTKVVFEIKIAHTLGGHANQDQGVGLCLTYDHMINVLMQQYDLQAELKDIFNVNPQRMKNLKEKTNKQINQRNNYL